MMFQPLQLFILALFCIAKCQVLSMWASGSKETVQMLFRKVYSEYDTFFHKNNINVSTVVT